MIRRGWHTRRLLTFQKRNFCAPRPELRAIECSGLGKGKDLPVTENPLQMGDDSQFITSPLKFQDKIVLGIGVADGVGGWRDPPFIGNPDLVAQQLMKHCHDTFLQYYKHIHQASFNPAIICSTVLATAYERLLGKPPGAGSSTAIISHLEICNDGKAYCHYKTLGDSGLFIFRKLSDTEYKPVHASPILQTYGAPFQLYTGLKELEMSPQEWNSYLHTLPGHGEVASLILEHDDVIVMGSDGLLDNMNYMQVTNILNSISSDDPSFCHTLNTSLIQRIDSNWRKFDDLSIVSAKIKLK